VCVGVGVWVCVCVRVCVCVCVCVCVNFAQIDNHACYPQLGKILKSQLYIYFILCISSMGWSRFVGSIKL